MQGPASGPGVINSNSKLFFFSPQIELVRDPFHCNSFSPKFDLTFTKFEVDNSSYSLALFPLVKRLAGQVGSSPDSKKACWLILGNVRRVLV